MEFVFELEPNCCNRLEPRVGGSSLFVQLWLLEYRKMLVSVSLTQKHPQCDSLVFYLYSQSLPVQLD